MMQHISNELKIKGGFKMNKNKFNIVSLIISSALMTALVAEVEALPMDFLKDMSNSPYECVAIVLFGVIPFLLRFCGKILYLKEKNKGKKISDIISEKLIQICDIIKNPKQICNIISKKLKEIFCFGEKREKLKKGKEKLKKEMEKIYERYITEYLLAKLKKKSNARKRRASSGVFCSLDYSKAMAVDLPEAASSAILVISGKLPSGFLEGKIVGFVARFLPKELLVPFGLLCVLIFVRGFIRSCEKCFESDFIELKKETDLDVKIEKLDKKLKRSHRSNYVNCNFHGYDYGNGFVYFISRRSYAIKKKKKKNALRRSFFSAGNGNLHVSSD
jgi:hypothetical protein